MDIKKLNILKNKGKNQSILIVEDSKLLQTQIHTFLSKFFKYVYQAVDGEDGIVQYNKYHPDIIITDISMPKKNGLEMIKEIKLLNNNVKIIILSAHNEEEVLMNIIKLNIESFLLKPLNIESFIDVLVDIFEKATPTKYTECLEALSVLHKQKGRVQLVNYFDDMMVEQEGEVINIFDDIVTIKIPHTQILAVDYENNTIIELKAIKKFMRCKLLEIDKENHLIHLARPMYAEYTLRSTSHKQYFYNSTFSLVLHDNHKYFELNVLDIVSDSVTLYIDEEETALEIYDNVNLTIALEFDEIKQNKDIYARGKIMSIDNYKTGLRIIVNMETEEKDLADFKRYLAKIEKGIIKELIEKQTEDQKKLEDQKNAKDFTKAKEEE